MRHDQRVIITCNQGNLALTKSDYCCVTPGALHPPPKQDVNKTKTEANQDSVSAKRGWVDIKQNLAKSMGLLEGHRRVQ